MARKKKQEEHENHERWLVSYADFITLLFAFFVVMYSISSVNEGKYRVLSSSIVSAFNKPAKSLSPIQYGTQMRAPIIQHKVIKKDQDAKARVGVDHQVMPSVEELAKMQKVADEVKHNLQDMIDEGLVDVNKTSKGLEIEINSEILFSSGTANLNQRAKSALRRIAKILKKQENEINVEGFTDNVPIRSERFPSNWELSASRAASVVHLFTDSGISPERLAAIGYGEYKPIASNKSESGRRKNRRVAIMMLNKRAEDRIRIDDRTKEQKEKDAKRKLMRSFGVNSKKNSSDEQKSKITTIGIKKLSVLPNNINSSTKSTIPTETDKLTSRRTPTTLGKKPVILKQNNITSTDEQEENPKSLTTSPKKPTVILLPQPIVLPSR